MHFRQSGNGVVSAEQLLSVGSLPPYSPDHHLVRLPMKQALLPLPYHLNPIIYSVFTDHNNDRQQEKGSSLPLQETLQSGQHRLFS